MKTIYILLTRTGTYFARLIRAVTGEEFSHASISLDRELNQLYSFGRLHYRVPFIGGFIREDVHTGVFGRNPHALCVLYKLDVPDDIYEQIESRVSEMSRNRGSYRYNMIGLAACLLGIKYRRSRHFLCSQFVADVLERSGALDLPRDVSLMQPGDFLKISSLRPVYRGSLIECAEGRTAMI